MGTVTKISCQLLNLAEIARDSNCWSGPLDTRAEFEHGELLHGLRARAGAVAMDHAESPRAVLGDNEP